MPSGKLLAWIVGISALTCLGLDHYKARKGWPVRRHLSFWLAVAGVSVLANFGLEAAANSTRIPGLARFTAFTHKGAS